MKRRSELCFVKAGIVIGIVIGKEYLSERRVSAILTSSESVRFLVCYLLISFGKSANAFSKFFRNNEEPKKNNM